MRVLLAGPPWLKYAVWGSIDDDPFLLFYFSDAETRKVEKPNAETRKLEK